MFWNSEFLSVSSRHDELLSQSTKLSEILYDEELLQELKTSNVIWVNFLIRPEIIKELVDNITQLTEKDCFDKLVYSKTHAAYLSCEILTSGVTEIFSAFMQHPESLEKVMNCLVYEPEDTNSEQTISATSPGIKEGRTNGIDNSKLNGTSNDNYHHKSDEDDDESKDNLVNGVINIDISNSVSGGGRDNKNSNNSNIKLNGTENAGMNEDNTYDNDKDLQSSSFSSSPSSSSPSTGNHSGKRSRKLATKVVPQKASLISKLINTIHSTAPADLGCHITKNVESFSKLIRVLVENIHVSGSFDILSTFINRTTPPESRYVFCELLAKLDFVNSIINVMTLSNLEDKQRNACQLLCDIIVHGRQEASEQQTIINGQPAQDMLVEQLESQEAVRLMLSQMFPKDPDRDLENGKSENGMDENSNRDSTNVTAIICGMKVLRCLIELRKTNSNSNNTGSDMVKQAHETLVFNAMRNTQDAVEEYLIKFHELLLNPPKQEPIKTTCGVIQKPLGYIRLEVVNLIRALISVNSPRIIMKLVELNTMDVIIDLFINYSWNNLLHTQVEQALCLIIKHCRNDEDSFFTDYWNRHQVELYAPSQENNQSEGRYQVRYEFESELKVEHEEGSQSEEKQSCVESKLEQQPQEVVTPPEKQASTPQEEQRHQTPQDEPSEQQLEQSPGTESRPESEKTLSQLPLQEQQEQQQQEQESTDQENRTEMNQASPTFFAENFEVPKTPSIALFNRLLNECDLIGRLLKCRSGEANFGHIIKIINSIAINCDLDIIKSHLKEIETKRPELFDRWNTFVSVDVASFKKTSVFFDTCLLNAGIQTDDRNAWVDHHGNNNDNGNNNNINNNNNRSINSVTMGAAYAAAAFSLEEVLPTINVDVLPKARCSVAKNLSH